MIVLEHPYGRGALVASENKCYYGHFAHCERIKPLQAKRVVVA